MARHDVRDHRGRFTASGAPIPQGEDHTGADTLAYPYNPAKGAAQRPNPHRRAIHVDASSSEQLDSRISEVRAPDLRVQPANVVSSPVHSMAYGDEYGRRPDPMQPEPRRARFLPRKGQHDEEPGPGLVDSLYR